MKLKRLHKYIDNFSKFNIVKLFHLALFVISPLLVFSQSVSMAYVDYIEEYKDVAIRQQQEYGIPASITLAQGLLESGAGLSDLARIANNHFGIKCHKMWTGKGFYQDDDEKSECFRSYDNAMLSFEDHARFLKQKRYSVLFTYKVTDYSDWAKGLKQCGYATDPAYPEKLIGVIEKYQLYKYDSNQPRVAKRKYLKGDETMEHSIEEAIVQEVCMIHPIKRKWGLYYVIAHNGDSFQAISEEFGIDTKNLAKFNDYDTKTPHLHKGEIIYLQEKAKSAPIGCRFHIVSRGETLHSISQLYGLRLKTLLKLNNLKSNSKVTAGNELKLR